MSVVRFFGCFAILSLPCVSHGADWAVSGYGKSYFVFQDDVSVGGYQVQQEQIQLQNAVRLMISAHTQGGHDFELHYEVQPTFSVNKNRASSGLSPQAALTSSSYRLDDLSSEVDQSDHSQIFQNLDRLNIQIHLEHGDLTLGRQAIAFGSARMVNPMDLFVPYALQTLNTEYRVGIDGIRYQHYLSDFALLDMGVIIGKDSKPEGSAAFIRSQTSIEGNDIEMMMIQLDQAQLFAAGLQRSLGDFGAWIETAYLNTSQSSSDQKRYWRTSLGIDYAVNEDVFMMLELHHNGAGTDQAKHYLSKTQNAAYEQYGVYLLGKEYVMPSFTVTINPLLTIASSLVYNLDDQSSLLNLVAETSWSENQYSQFGLYQGFGKDLGLSNSVPEIQSEYGASPLIVYASFGVYF